MAENPIAPEALRSALRQLSNRADATFDPRVEEHISALIREYISFDGNPDAMGDLMDALHSFVGVAVDMGDLETFVGAALMPTDQSDPAFDPDPVSSPDPGPVSGLVAASGPASYPASGPDSYPAPGPGSYPASGPGYYPASGPGSHPASGPVTASGPGSYSASGPVTTSGPGSYPAPGPGYYPASGPGSYPAPDPGSVTESDPNPVTITASDPGPVTASGPGSVTDHVTVTITASDPASGPGSGPVAASNPGSVTSPVTVTITASDPGSASGPVTVTVTASDPGSSPVTASGPVTGPAPKLDKTSSVLGLNPMASSFVPSFAAAAPEPATGAWNMEPMAGALDAEEDQQQQYDYGQGEEGEEGDYTAAEYIDFYESQDAGWEAALGFVETVEEQEEMRAVERAHDLHVLDQEFPGFDLHSLESLYEVSGMDLMATLDLLQQMQDDIPAEVPAHTPAPPPQEPPSMDASNFPALSESPPRPQAQLSEPSEPVHEAATPQAPAVPPPQPCAVEPVRPEQDPE